MDIYSIKQNLVAIQQIGHTLDVPQRMKLQMGLLKLTDLARADQLLFWGKILTTAQPYYIAIGIDYKDQYAFPHKKFYYSTSNMQFKQLPSLDQFNKQKVDTFYHLPFSGDPNTILINIQGQQGQQNKQKQQQIQQQDSQQQQQIKILPKNYTELDRLSYAVHSIEIDCQLVPVGGIRMTEKHQIRINEGFQGFKLADLSFKKFQHFRYPLNRAGVDKLQKPQAVFVADFLEPIQNTSQWSLQTNTTKDFVTVRNLMWQGYVAYSRLGSKNFGGIYYGNGIKNVDIPFYI